MLVPEVILHNLITKCVKLTAADWLDPAVIQKRKILTKLFKTDDNGDEIKVGKFSYLDAAVSIFVADIDKSRKLEVSFGYNTNRAGLPTIHILLPQENTGQMNGIGFDQGQDEGDYDEDEDLEDDNTSAVTYARSFDATYAFCISSDNSSEAILIYQWLRAMLISSVDHLNLKGIENPKFSGQDLALTQDLVEPGIFNRNLLISFTYNNDISTFIRETLSKIFAFEASSITQETEL